MCGTQEHMTTRHHTRLVHEGDYVAKVDVDLIRTDAGWSPYLSLDDAHKLDSVREALRRGDVKTASRLARVFTLTPVDGQKTEGQTDSRHLVANVQENDVSHLNEVIHVRSQSG